jgi:hypothetical protein
MFGVEDLTRIRIQEATQEGLRSQYVKRSLGGQRNPAVMRLLLALLLVALLAIALM